jgi:membrane-bound lytic murein transglycosylase D
MPRGGKTLSYNRFLALLLFILSLITAGCATLGDPAKRGTAAEEPQTFPEEVDLEPVVEEYADPMTGAQECYEKGLQAYELGDRETAREYFQKSLALLMEAEPDTYTLERISQFYANGFVPEPTVAPELEPEPVSEASPDETTETGEEPEEQEESNSLHVVMNEHVERELAAYCGSLRKAFAEGMARGGKYLPMIKEIIEHEGLPPELAYLPLVESNFKVKARSRAGASGLWQFMPRTGRNCGLTVDQRIDERYDIEKSTYAAVRHLSKLHNLFGSWEIALAAYNAGEFGVFRGMASTYERDYWKLLDASKQRRARILPRETRRYVPKFMAAVTIAQNPEEYGFRPIVENPLQYDKILIKGSVSLDPIARECGVSLTTLRELNPELKISYTPNREEGYELKVPAGTSEKLQVALAKMPVTRGVDSFRHRISRGETLSTIAERYGSPIQDIMLANNLRNRNRIRAGQYLNIPTAVRGTNRSEPPPATRTDEGLVYTVKRGDSLWGISKAFGVTLNDLRRRNPGLRRGGRDLKPGDKILVKTDRSSQGVPAASSTSEVTHLVKRGDTLWDVARKYKVSVNEIKSRNNLRNSRIDPGDKLIIPRK